MILRYGKTTLAAVAFTALGLALLPACASAQDSGDTTDKSGQTNQEISTQKVSLNVESADLYYTLKLLFNQIKANFTLDNSLRGIPVTISLRPTPFQVALEAVLKSSPTPLTYRFENGIYSIIPKVEEVDTSTTNPDDDGGLATKRAIPRKIFRGAGLVYNSAHVVEILGGRTIQAFTPFGNGGMGGGSGMGGMGSGMGGLGGMSGGMGGIGGGMGGGMSGGISGMGGGMGGGMMGGMGGFGGGFGRG